MAQLRTIDPQAFTLSGLNSYLGLARLALLQKRNADARDYLKAALSVARKANPNACKHIRRALFWNEKAYQVNMAAFIDYQWSESAIPRSAFTTGGDND